ELLGREKLADRRSGALERVERAASRRLYAIHHRVGIVTRRRRRQLRCERGPCTVGRKRVRTGDRLETCALLPREQERISRGHDRRNGIEESACCVSSFDLIGGELGSALRPARAQNFVEELPLH